MIKEDDFKIDGETLYFKQDLYPLSKIQNARVKTNTLKDHLTRMIAIGFLVTSVVWAVCPASFGLLTAPIALIAGTLAALSSARKYELQVEFKHKDETGLQWIVIAKANRTSVKNIFDKQAINIQQHHAS
ncbi:hypothetical protein [Enterovibrio calviensis]|uniref:hypothetical protein n=1 Tax=Enterovibrio calviensis TaxID=91359 RepID=UPI0004870D25|nr:hypothetical protein [Enterovibrio calviensis]